VTSKRTPEEILQAMDKPDVSTNSNLLTQLNAELSVALSLEAKKVSERNLKVAYISLGVAFVALVISLVQMFVSANVCSC
jgi:hypothetical protein